MEDWIPLVALTGLISSVINFVKYISARDKNGIVTQVAVWLAGVLAVVLFAHTAFADTVPVGGVSLDQVNVWTQIFVGLTIGGVASFATDVRKALDNNDTAAKPPLVKEG